MADLLTSQWRRSRQDSVPHLSLGQGITDELAGSTLFKATCWPQVYFSQWTVQPLTSACFFEWSPDLPEKKQKTKNLNPWGDSLGFICPGFQRFVSATS